MSTIGLAVEHARRQFLAERRTGIGGSDIAALDPAIGSPYASTWSVWARLVGLIPDTDAPTFAMELGTNLEPVIAQEFTRRTGLTVVGAGAQRLERHRRAPHHIAHLDGLVYESADSAELELEAALGVFEAKSTGDDWAELPRHYAAQVQWALHVTGLAQGWVAALAYPYGRPRFDIYEVEADASAQARLAEVADRFWEDYVLTGRAPPADDHTATTRAIAAAWGHLDTVKVPTVDFTERRRIVEELSDTRKRRAALERHERYLENEAKLIFGRAGLELELADAPSEGFLDGALAISWRQVKARDAGVLVQSVRADHGDRYDKPRGAPSRRLELHGRWRP